MIQFNRKISVIIAVIIGILQCAAQTQSGYVRTLGRPDKKGEPLSGVSIRAKGEHNTVLSDDDGNFSLLLTGKKNGDAYSLQQVVKSGYELNESGVIGRPYAFSDKIPLTIVMVSTAQLQAEKIRIENNAYRVAENNYKLRLASLERQREEKSITAEEYRKEIQDLQDRFEKYQSLISSLAEHYAHTDYDVLNKTEREINLCIENGDLERADSLIHTLFNPVDVLKRNSESLARIDRNIRQANEIIRQANEDMAAVLKQQAKDAERLYQLYTISLARFDNENAARYIETRAQLDTTNVEWQLEAGNFLHYLSYDNKAREYYEYALHNTINQSGVHNVAKCYNYIGMTYDDQGYYTKSLEYYNKSLNIWKQLGILNQEVVANYNNIGSCYEFQGNDTKALSYYQKALDLQLTINDKNYSQIATIKLNIAISYKNKALYVGELESRVDKYEDELGTYIMKISTKILNKDDSETLNMMLHSIGDFERISDHACNLCDSARELHNKQMEFSPKAKTELDILCSAVREVVDISFDSFKTNNIKEADKVEPLEELIDTLTVELKARHIRRLREGKCTIELGFAHSDILNNLERVSDHCSNIAVDVIQSDKENFDTHEYLDAMKNRDNQQFAREYKEYKEKYRLPETRKFV